MKTRIYNKSEYLSNLINKIEHVKSGGRVLLATMDFDAQHSTYSRLLTALVRASEREVTVIFIVDAYSFLYGQTSRQKNKRAQNKAWLGALKKSGAIVTICNKPKFPVTIPFMGRSHIKCAVVDDVVYLGGCNLNNPNELDLMLELTCKDAAGWVYAQMLLVAETCSTETAFKYKDLAHQLPSGDTILIDAGKRRQSSILAVALNLIDTAKAKILITCQFFPGGPTGKGLKGALQRNCKVKLYYSQPAAHGGSAYLQHLYNWVQKRLLPEELFSRSMSSVAPKLHAKVLVSERCAIIGSHNYVWQGVCFGTAEIAFITTNSQVITQLDAAVEDLVYVSE